MEKSAGTGIKDKHPGSATLGITKKCTVYRRQKQFSAAFSGPAPFLLAASIRV
jgi:hypothetical protein